MVITGELANSIDAIQANGHPIRSPPIQFNNVTLESSGRIGCRDESGEAYVFRYFKYLRCFWCSSQFFLKIPNEK